VFVFVAVVGVGGDVTFLVKLDIAREQQHF
jgi:hypothetical protein